MTDNQDLNKRFDELERRLDGLVAPHPFSAFKNLNSSDDEIDLGELWNVIWAGKWIIVGVTFIFALASVFLALNLPNIYRSEVLLSPAEDNSGGGLAGLAGQFGGLASLAGVNLGVRQNYACYSSCQFSGICFEFHRKSRYSCAIDGRERLGRK